MTLPTLETERFFIRPLQESDLDLMLEMDTDPEIMKHVGGAMTEEEVRSRLPNYLHRDEEKIHGQWCIVSKTDGERHGLVLVKPMPVEEPNGRLFDTIEASGIEIGYRLRKTSWGKGIATEASEPFLALQFDEVGLDRLIACIDPENNGSQNVLKKLGMRYIGETPAYGLILPTFEITAAEWRAARNS
ncbi:GNAT family N-acetyltransferase [Aestuariispira insulae]|uniref:RimJ/RimL family protein N-acetyltransferase n=1 Tax=Aestuariispira insulae TaxID=1461337 RepID=A0A3D9HVH8_9PROT|nr:GNAT family N-acetyltransferase [Aestuariispira insulae]RED53498.1 RimJ/RimL family protein N-acetyltransferase [Aestuariispira insulae]